MAEEQTPAWMKQLLGTPATPEGGSTPSDQTAKKPGEVFLKHGSRDDLLPPGTPPRQQSDRTHEGLPAPAAEAAPSAIESLGGVSPKGVTNPRFVADDLAEESWMKKDPMTWQPMDGQERIRWKKTFTGAENVEWNKLIKEQSYWHLATRDGRQPAYTLNNPQFLDFMKRKRDFYSRTVPRWRKLEQQNPPRHYRRRADLEALGGNEFEVAQT